MLWLYTFPCEKLPLKSNQIILSRNIWKFLLSPSVKEPGFLNLSSPSSEHRNTQTCNPHTQEVVENELKVLANLAYTVSFRQAHLKN